MVLDLFEKYNIHYSIKTIYTGLRTNFIFKEELENFAIDLIGLDEYKDNTFINDLIFEIDSIGIDDIFYGIEQTFNLKGFKYSDDEFKEFLRIQYVTILDALEKLKNNKIYRLIHLIDDLIDAFDLFYYSLKDNKNNILEKAKQNMFELEDILYNIYPVIEDSKVGLQKLYNYMDKLKIDVI